MNETGDYWLSPKTPPRVECGRPGPLFLVCRNAELCPVFSRSVVLAYGVK